MDSLFAVLELLEDTLWVFAGFPIILLLGGYFTYRSRFIQVRNFPKVLAFFYKLIKTPSEKEGIHPLKAFFACIGGCVGIGNIVGICTAVQIGGPGALFWVWVTAILGVMLKYSEVYLGVKYRVSDGKGNYSGGPQYFLQRAFKSRFIPALIALLLCIYGVEVFQFSVITTSVALNTGIDRFVVALTLLSLVLFAGLGGVKRVGEINSAIIPVFVVLFVGMGFWVLIQNYETIPSVISSVFGHAFSSHAAFGGFVGSTLAMTISQGIRRGCYSGDLGVGYASVIHSETSLHKPEQQAALTFFDIFIDTFMICTTSIMIILTTGIWKEQMDTSLLIQTALGLHFPYMHFFMPFFLFLLGYSTINAYFVVGSRCASYLSPRFGKPLFFLYATCAFITFSFVDPPQAQVVMSLVNGLLLLINGIGIWKLRKEISFEFSDEHIHEPVRKPITD